VFLGAIAGVSARLPTVKPLLEGHKKDYYSFYVREIIGSKSPLPAHVATALGDFFGAFSTPEELQKEVIPPIEKALLRAPEVVLNDMVSPMVLALPEEMDLSAILHSNLLKPLLSNIKSTNAAIRAGALRTFQALAARSYNDDTIAKVADEILTPLKQGKVTTADQKVLHAQMLSSLSGSVPLAQKIPPGLVSVALKEPNEPAVVAELSAMTKHLECGLANGVPLDKSVSEAFVKGMTDKRVPVRRLWAIRAADIWWGLDTNQHTQSDIQSFCQTTLPKLVEMWQDVNTNPIPATQSGMVTVGHSVTALLLIKVHAAGDDKLSAIYKKANVESQSLTVQPKPSFLLNPRVYTKLNTAEDVDIALRALIAVVPLLSKRDTTTEARDAWAQAFIFFIVAQSIPSKAKAAAKRALTDAYLKSPAQVYQILFDGLWTWYKALEQGDKESAAAAAKSGTADLTHVLSALCLPEGSFTDSRSEVSKEILRRQCVDLLLLARPDIVPRASWIDLCLRMGVDPGQLVRDHLKQCLELIMEATTVLHPFPMTR
jgi:hypothetical protein